MTSAQTLLIDFSAPRRAPVRGFGSVRVPTRHIPTDHLCLRFPSLETKDFQCCRTEPTKPTKIASSYALPRAGCQGPDGVRWIGRRKHCCAALMWDQTPEAPRPRAKKRAKDE